MLFSVLAGARGRGAAGNTRGSSTGGRPSSCTSQHRHSNRGPDGRSLDRGEWTASHHQKDRK